jgi:hypothetical protein
VLPKKWDAESRFNRPFADAYNDFMPIRNDGTFRFVAVPGKAVVAFRCDPDRYPIAREAPTIRLPGGLAAENFQAFATIDPKPGNAPVTVTFTLDAGRVVKGTLLDPKGKPLAGVLAAGLHHDWLTDATPLRTAEFTVLGCDPARARLVCFAQPQRKLAGSVVVRGDESGPITVRLKPWASVRGRLLDAEGKPIRNARWQFVSVPVTQPDQPRGIDVGLHVIFRSAYEKKYKDPETDAEGRFQIECLVPGLKYNLARYDESGALDYEDLKWTDLAFSNLVLKPGETRDLGDVRVKPFPKK